MINLAKQYANEQKFDLCNQVLATYVASPHFIAIANSYLTADIDFYSNAINQFSMTVVSDTEADPAKRDEPPYGSILSQSAFAKLVHTDADLMTHLLHTASHQRCDILWQDCSISMDTFDKNHLDIIEEIYNQRIVKDVAPSAFMSFLIVVAKWDQLDGKLMPQSRVDMQQLLTDNATHPIYDLHQLHWWLYTVDPLNPRVFNHYIKIWVNLLQNDQMVVDAINQYVQF